jgi:membrane protein YqaA with SNARE-associated domain
MSLRAKVSSRLGNKNVQLPLAAFVWGLAEATFFFLVPDVILTWIAVTSRATLRPSILCATAGALVGGVFMYHAGAYLPTETMVFLDAVPAISLELIAACASNLERHSFFALFFGAFSGQPYKIYAALAGSEQLPLSGFMFWSIPARAVRFTLVSLVAAALFGRLASAFGVQLATRALLGGWFIFYCWYFVAMQR